jgi:hypothetical protein
MTGARIMTTLLNNLDAVEGTLGSNRCASRAAWAKP